MTLTAKEVNRGKGRGSGNDHFQRTKFMDSPHVTSHASMIEKLYKTKDVIIEAFVQLEVLLEHTKKYL